MLELVDVPAIAAMLGLHQSRVRQLAALDTFPAPAASLCIGRVWRRRDIERWNATRPGPGRPRKNSGAASSTKRRKVARPQPQG